MTPNTIYLDYAATTPIDEQVLAAMQPYYRDAFYNPSATYQAARNVRTALERARALAAHWLGARSSEIIFTAGATEANNVAIHGIMQRFPEAHMVVSAIEHDSVLQPARRYNTSEVAMHADGIVDSSALQAAIHDKTVLISIMYANNEIGTVQPLREIRQMIERIREDRRASGNMLPLYFHSDAAQAGNYLDLHTARLGVDLLSLNGSKLYGPKQSGLLYVKAGLVLLPLLQGGGQERNLRSGTENVAGSIGMATALNLAQQQRQQEVHRLQALQHQFFDGALRLPGAAITGSLTKRLPNNVHLRFEGQDNERLLIALDEKGIMAAAGSACSASNGEPSHVLRALGLSNQEAQSSLRFSMGRATTTEQISRSLEVLRELLALTV